MALVRRQIAHCTLGGLTVVTIAFEDVMLKFLGLRLRGPSSHLVTMRLREQGQPDIVEVRGRRFAADVTLLKPSLSMERRTDPVTLIETIHLPSTISISCEWNE